MTIQSNIDGLAYSTHLPLTAMVHILRGYSVKDMTEIKRGYVTVSCNNNLQTNTFIITENGGVSVVYMSDTSMSGTYDGANGNYVRLIGDGQILFESNVVTRAAGSVYTKNYKDIRVEIASRHATAASTSSEFFYTT